MFYLRVDFKHMQAACRLVSACKVNLLLNKAFLLKGQMWKTYGFTLKGTGHKYLIEDNFFIEKKKYPQIYSMNY